MAVECAVKIMTIPNYFFVKCAMLNIIFIVLIRRWIEFQMETFTVVSVLCFLGKSATSLRSTKETVSTFNFNCILNEINPFTFKS